MYKVVKSIDVDFAHQIHGHQGGCANIHGHTWRFEVCLGDLELDEMGFVVDFGKVSTFLQGVKDLFDHSLVLDQEVLDTCGDHLVKVGSILKGANPFARDHWFSGIKCCSFGGLKVCACDFKPTCETLAEWLYRSAVSQFPLQVVCWVRVYESLHPNLTYVEYNE